MALDAFDHWYHHLPIFQKFVFCFVVGSILFWTSYIYGDPTGQWHYYWKQQTIASTPHIENMTYTGTLGMVNYGHGYFGVVTETTVTFMDNVTWTFNKQDLRLNVGKNYTVHYQNITYPNWNQSVPMPFPAPNFVPIPSDSNMTTYEPHPPAPILKPIDIIQMEGVN